MSDNMAIAAITVVGLLLFATFYGFESLTMQNCLQVADPETCQEILRG
jgi:hypothetical protein